MRIQKALFNVAVAGILQVVAVLVNFIIPPLILKEYGSELNGLRASICQLISYFSIIEMGIGGALTFSFYRPIAENDINKINSILVTAKKQYFKVGIYCCIFIGILLLVYPFVISGNIPFSTTIGLILALGLSGIINYFTINKYIPFLSASQKQYIISFARIAYFIINMLVMVICIKLQCSIVVTYFSGIIANLINIFMIICYIKKKYKAINFNAPPDEGAVKQRYDVMVHQISVMVVTTAPMVVMTVLCGLEEVSVYSIYLLIFNGIVTITNVFNSGLVASFGELMALKDKESLFEAYSQFEFIFYNIVSVIYSCALILGLPFITVYTKGVNDANYYSVILLILFTVAGILTNVKIPQTTIIQSAGKYKETRWRAIMEAIMTLIVSIISIYCLGVNGCLIGSISGLLFRTIDIGYSHKITSFPLQSTLLRIARILLAIVITILPFILFIDISVNSYSEWIISAVIIFAWAVFVDIGISFFFEKETFMKVLSRFKVLMGDNTLN